MHTWPDNFEPISLKKSILIILKDVVLNLSYNSLLEVCISNIVLRGEDMALCLLKVRMRYY